MLVGKLDLVREMAVKKSPWQGGTSQGLGKEVMTERRKTSCLPERRAVYSPASDLSQNQIVSTNYASDAIV